MFQKNLDAMEEEGKILEIGQADAVIQSQKQFDKNVLIDQRLDLYENHILQLEGGCERALRALGVEVVVNPDKKEGAIVVNPFVHSPRVRKIQAPETYVPGACIPSNGAGEEI